MTCSSLNLHHLVHHWSVSCLGIGGFRATVLRSILHLYFSISQYFASAYFHYTLSLNQVDSCTESAEAACDILSQLVNCTIKTLGLISTARPSFMDVSQVRLSLRFLCPFISSPSAWM